MDTESTRRGFLYGTTLAAAGWAAGAAQRSAGAAEQPAESHHHHAPGEADQVVPDYPRDHPGVGGPVGSDTDRGKLVPGLRGPDEPPVPVVTPDVPKLPWKMNAGWKEFHLVAEHVRREFLPNQWFDVWGYNGSMPGPTIEAIEGDRVRVVVHNDLPEPTTVHWHGFELLNRFDGVPGLTQDPIPPGKKFVYEFDLHQNGTFFYHSHGPMQEVMGMSGLFIIHPRRAYRPPVDHDFGLVLHEFSILPQSTIPNSISEEFNFFTINGRSGPYATPMVVKLGSRVRIRFMNLSPMDHHPMHLHGHTFWITGTEAGRIPESAWIPSNNVLVSVGQSRDVEFVANNPGDWALHCHILHHMMNHMVAMVGPMGHQSSGMPAGVSMATSMGMLERGPALADEHGAALGRGLGPATDRERAAATGMMLGPEHRPRSKVPGYPQDMMGTMHRMKPEEVKKVTKPETEGMRRTWHQGIEAMMTVVRVLPPDLYDQVMAGKDVPPGASVPGGGPGQMPQGHQH
jgi:FtsP/CotA-like multicopper oxidase with cupredoxin domain